MLAADYHKACVTFAENFASVMTGECPNIVWQLDSCLKKQADENRKRLVPLIETIILCGRQELRFEPSRYRRCRTTTAK